MTSQEAVQKLSDAAKAIQHGEGIKRGSTRYAAVCLMWAPRWARDKGPAYAAGYLAALYGSNRMLPDGMKMHQTMISALWMAAELLENGYLDTEAPAAQIENMVEALGQISETEDAVPEPVAA